MRRESRPPTTNRQQRDVEKSPQRLVGLKQLQAELGVDAAAMRTVLRHRYGTHRKRYYWVWPEDEAEDVRRYLRRALCLDGGGES